jgi:hypothetical protein
MHTRPVSQPYACHKIGQQELWLPLGEAAPQRVSFHVLWRCVNRRCHCVRSFLGSLYVFCTTVTTVGYGDIVPYTSGGKWFVMVSCTAGFVVNLVRVCPSHTHTLTKSTPLTFTSLHLKSLKE